MRELNTYEVTVISGAGFIAKTITDFGINTSVWIGEICSEIVGGIVPDYTIPLTSFNLRDSSVAIIDNIFYSVGKAISTKLGNSIESYMPILKNWRNDGSVDWHGIVDYFK